MAGGDFVRYGLNDRDESQFRLYPLTLSPQSGDPQVLGRARQGLYPDSLLPGPGAGAELHHEHLNRRRL